MTLLILGSQATGDNAGAETWSPIRNLFMTLPPVLAAVQDQTGMTAPSWMIKQPESSDMMLSKGHSLSDSTTASC
jgi:hypothetical protein